MGCGTALPSLAILQWRLAHTTSETSPSSPPSISLGLADYNPSVLQLVTVPNILLTWAQSRSLSDLGSSWPSEGEFDISPELLRAFTNDLVRASINLSFYSGAWSPE